MKKCLWLLAACSLAGATFSCSSDSDSTCVLNEVTCEDGVLYTCIAENPRAVKGEPCESGVCENALKCKAPIISCTPNEKTCKENIHHICNAAGNGWTSLDCGATKTVCAAEKACVECVVVGDCANGSIDCKDNKCVKEQVVVCTAGATKCQDGKLLTCASNAWNAGDNCANGFVCLNGEDKCSDANAFHCAFTELTASPENGTATGKAIVKKGVKIIAGGLYCTNDLTKTVATWQRTSTAPIQNMAYTGSDADEWQSATITNRPASTNYCTFVVQLEDDSYHACPKSATLGVTKDSQNVLKLTEDETRIITITCGDSVIDAKEECDGLDVGTAVCPNGKTGKATCTKQCKLSYAECLDSGIEYKYLVDFDGFEYNNRYDIDKTLTKDGKIISLLGAILLKDNVIDANTLIIADKTEGYVKVESETPGANIGVGTLSFQYRSWITAFNGSIDTFDKTKHKIEVFINDETEAAGEVVLDGEYPSLQTATITINRDATSIKISKQPMGLENAPRVLIDNIKWSDKKN